MQLGHSGPKGSTQLGWETMDAPLPRDNWQVIGPSPVAWSPANQVPREMTCADIDRASRDVIADAGWADAFSHSTGHGVGLEIHEAPRVAATGRDTLVVSDVVTVEPGVYLPGIGGVRIEDTVVVGAAGCEPLTLTPKDLVL